MKKIGIVDYDFSVRGGVEQVSVSLAAALADYYEVHLISLCMGGEAAYELDERVRFAALSGPERRLREMRRELKKPLCGYFNDHDIDVALIMGNYPGLLASTARFGAKKTKLVFCDHGALMNQWERKDIVFIRFVSSLLCHRVVTLTQQSRDDYRRKFHLKKSKVLCIPNWIDLDKPHSDAYQANSKKILSAGRFGPEKGFDLLVKAFAPVARRHPDWQLDLFGDGEMMETVRTLVAELELESNVRLLGMRTDLAERYRDYAMYALPSYREGMPLVLLEAKANRLPIVSFDILTGPREIVRDGVDGFLIAPYDLDAMSDAICRLIEDDALRQSMSDRSQENLEQFSKPAIVDSWRTLIDSL